ncbi:MAG: T9SS type A sorting domain-containing protein [Flavobacteriales bacterium]
MKTFLTSLICLLSVQEIFTQNCYEGNLNFDNQEQIDQFIIDYPDVDCINGYVFVNFDPDNFYGLVNILEINGYFSGYHTHFIGLENLQSIGIIELLTSPDFTALESLTTVSFVDLSEFFSCVGAIELTNQIVHYSGVIDLFNSNVPPILDVFNNLETVSTIDFWNVSGLTELHGFENLHTVGAIRFYGLNVTVLPDFNSLQFASSLEIEGCYNLMDLPNMGEVTELDLLRIADADITNFMPLLGLEAVYGEMRLTYLNNLDDCSGLDSLTTLGPGFHKIGHNPNLESLNGLESLQYIEDGLWITNNGPLDDISALDHIVSISGILDIDSNSELTTCDVEAICNLIANFPEHVAIDFNNTGCNSIDEVAETCGFSTVHGTVVGDLDSNGILNMGDVDVPYTKVFNQLNNAVAQSDYDGDYSAYLPGAFTTTLHAQVPFGFESSYESITTTNETASYYKNIFIHPTEADLHNLSVTVNSTTPPTVGFNSIYNVHVCNYGPQAEDITAMLDISNMPGTNVVNSNGGVVSGSTITWTATDLQPFHCITFQVNIHVGAEVELGTLYYAIATCDFTDAGIDDDYTIDNSYLLNETVVGSFDPNDKTVNCATVPSTEIENGDAVELEYTIRFQNTGTAPAQTVRITDFLEPQLDINSIQLLNTSHDCEMHFLDNNELEWLFSEINLPDSASNEPESHGFIHFRINTTEGLTINDTITNNCSIYFDFNEAVVTNTATTSFWQCADLPEPIVVLSDDELSTQVVGDVTYQWYWNDMALAGENGINLIAVQTGSYYVKLTYADGCSASSQPVYFTHISESLYLNAALSISPNPANESFLITSNASLNGMSYQLKDITGKICLNGTIKEKTQVECAGLLPGVYIVVVSNERGSPVAHARLILE